MKQLSIITFLLIALNTSAQTNFITIQPGSCPNCMAAIELTQEQNNVYVFQDAYSIDSNSLRRRYKYLHNAKMIFSDSLYKLYSVNGLMSISNANGHLKALLTNFGNTANKYFSFWNSGRSIDSISYSNPIFKQSINKRIYDKNGNIYLLNESDNNVLYFDILNDQFIDTMYITKAAKIKAYGLLAKSKEGVLDSTGYEYYLNKLKDHIPDSLCTISDICLNKDTLLMYTANYFSYMGGKDQSTTFILKFPAIISYVNGAYKGTQVPSTIYNFLLDTSLKYNASTLSINSYDDKVYLSISESRYNKLKEQYIVAQYNQHTNKMSDEIRLPKEYNKVPFTAKPYFSDSYFIIPFASILFNTANNSSTDLCYFTQSFYDTMGYKYFPVYLNHDLKIDKNYINILYSNKNEKGYEYVRIDVKTKKIITQKHILDGNKIDPFNYDYVIEKKGNNQIFRYKVF